MKIINTIILNSLILFKKIIPYILAFAFMFGILWFIAFLGNIEQVVR